MVTVSIGDAEKNLPFVLERASCEEVSIVDKNGERFLLLSMRPKTREERLLAFQKMDEISERTSAKLKQNLAADGVTVEEFLKDALADG